MHVLKTARRLVRSAGIRSMDAYLGIDTTSQLETRAPTVFRPGTDQKHYESLDYVYLNGILNRLGLMPHDVFYDIGCGAGRVLCLAARRRVRRVVGIECVPELAD